MENIKSFKADALVIIYPNGQVKEMPIENKILHIIRKNSIRLIKNDNRISKLFLIKARLIKPKHFF